MGCITGAYAARYGLWPGGSAGASTGRRRSAARHTRTLGCLRLPQMTPSLLSAGCSRPKSGGMSGDMSKPA